MRVHLFCALAAGLLLAGPSRTPAQNDVKAILEKAVKAHGGVEKISKIKAMQMKASGRIELMGGLDFTQESSVEIPNKIRETMHLTIAGMQIDLITVYNGKEGWIKVATQETKELEGDTLAAVKDSIETMTIARMAFVGGKDYEATPLGESKVNDKAVVGVKITRKDHKDVNLYFDKETGLLAKLEHRVKDPMAGQDVTEERIILEYADLDGMKSGKKATINRDGKKFMDVEVTEAKLVDKIDPKEFEKP